MSHTEDSVTPDPHQSPPRTRRTCSRTAACFLAEPLEPRLLCSAELYAPSILAGRGITLDYGTGRARFLPDSRGLTYTLISLTHDLPDTAGIYSFSGAAKADAAVNLAEDPLGTLSYITLKFSTHVDVDGPTSYDSDGNPIDDTQSVTVPAHIFAWVRNGIERVGQYAIDPIPPGLSPDSIANSDLDFTATSAGDIAAVAHYSFSFGPDASPSFTAHSDPPLAAPAGAYSFLRTTLSTAAIITYTPAGIAFDFDLTYATLYSGTFLRTTPGNVAAWQTGIFTLAPPSAPTHFTAAAISPNAVQLAWKSTSPVAVKRWDGLSWITLVSLPANANTFSDTTTAPATTYFYDLTATNPAGETWADRYLSATTLQQSPPAQPTNFSATTTLTSTSTFTVQLAWTLPLALNNASFGLYIQKWNGTAWQVIALLPATATTFSEELPAWHNGLATLYNLTAFNPAGETWADHYVTITDN